MYRHRPGVIAPAVLVVLLVAVIVIGLGAGFYSYRALHQTTNTTNTTANTVVNESTNTDVVANTNTTTSNTNVTTNTNNNTNTSSTVTVSGRKTNGTVKWIAPVKITSLKIFATSDNHPGDFEVGGNGVTDVNGVNTTAATYYHVGDIISGKFSGGEVVLVTAWDEGPVQFPNIYYVVKLGSKLYYLYKESASPFTDSDGLNHSTLTADSYTLDDLHFPATINGPQAGQKLTQPSYYNFMAFFDDTNLKPVFTDATYGTVYTTKTYNQASKDVLGAAKNLFVSNGFFLKAPDSTTRLYEYVPSILSSQNVPNVTWSSGQKNTTQFSYTDIGGCGSYNYASVVDPSVITANDLTQVGTSATGEKIYGLVDQNNALLKSQYNDSYNPFGQSKVSYAAFVADHPLFFWTDPFGRLLKFQNATYQPQAECGKPVIYLYPTTPTKVHVDLQPAGGFTKSEPAYGRGWNVLAQPNGQLTNKADGRTYPYLFWEGRGGLYVEPSRGFVVSQNDVHTFLMSSLTKLGLNTQETNDFIDFWEPRMQGSPYYRVSFFGKQTMDQLAPLTVTPTPTTVIRVLMDFAPLARPVTIAPQTLSAPVRQGFTVVEWGGVLR